MSRNARMPHSVHSDMQPVHSSPPRARPSSAASSRRGSSWRTVSRWRLSFFSRFFMRSPFELSRFEQDQRPDRGSLFHLIDREGHRGAAALRAVGQAAGPGHAAAGADEILATQVARVELEDGFTMELELL